MARGLIGLADGMGEEQGGDMTDPGFARYPVPQSDADAQGLEGWLHATRRDYGIPHGDDVPAVDAAGPDVPPRLLVTPMPYHLSPEAAAGALGGWPGRGVAEPAGQAPAYPGHGHGQDPRLLLLADAAVPGAGAERIAAGTGAVATPVMATAVQDSNGQVPDDSQGAHDWFVRNEHEKRNEAAYQRDPVYRNWQQAQDHLVGAAGTAGVDPGTLARLAYVESKFSPTARPNGTTALGYGQMTDDAWIQAVREFGTQYGIPNARLLSRSQALAYGRNDPEFQAEMFARLTQKNIETGRGLGGSDDLANAYAMHLLGPGGGPQFLRAMAANPEAPVVPPPGVPAAVSPGAVRNNAPLLGGGITLRQAYENFGRVMRSDEAQRYGELAQARQKERK